MHLPEPTRWNHNNPISEIQGVLERLPGELDPVVMVSREVGVSACEIGGRTTQ